jgi:amidohydrolase
MEAARLKQRALARVGELGEELLDASHQIHAHPELCFEERFAHDLLTGALERHGVEVERHAFGLETAFAATVGSEGPTVAVCLEYDALPGVGHACGHNVIAAAGLGAGLALAALAEEAGGRVRILGTPAEEGGGGKVVMAEAGAFDGVDVAMMVHPADADLVAMDAIATSHLRVEFSGVAAHAAAFPHLGRNALDAAVLGYVNVAALRQHIEPTDRIHGIFVDGGQKPNIVPERAVMEWMVRSARFASLEPLQRRVEACFDAGAAASGCTCTYAEHQPRYADMVDNPVVAALFAGNSAALGRPLGDPAAGGQRVVGSTDMGNVSYLVPSIHPMVKVAPAGVSIHSHDFAGHARSAAGDEGVLHGARAMAATAVDLWVEPDLVVKARAAFDAAV